VQVVVLDLPQKGTNVVYATNFTSISLISSNPPLKMIQVDCVWQFMNAVSTNSILTYRRPD
jgi:hypothetical protein